MILRPKVKMIFSLRARIMHMVLDSTWSHTSECTFWVGTWPTPKSRSWDITNARKKPYHVLDFYVQDWHWMGSILNSNPCELVSLHWLLSGNIFLIGDFLPDEMVNLWIFNLGLTSAGCPPHTSSIWPWSGTPNVHLYNTFLEGLRHLLPWLKNQHGLSEVKKSYK